MESIVPTTSKLLENKFIITNNIDTVLSNRNESHFVSVKEEFLDANLCLESAASHNNRRILAIDNTVIEGQSPSKTMSNNVEDDVIQVKENEDLLLERINSRCQVDVIDMRNEQIMDYKFMFVYEDQTSKFVILRPLSSKDARNVAEELFDIFAIMEAPRVLQSGNGREFASQVVKELRSLWTDVFIVHGEIIIPSSSTRRDFKQLLTTWLIQNPGKTWCEGLRFIQIIENRTSRTVFARTPHELVFANHHKDELKTLSITKETTKAIWCEEDWQKLIKNRKELNQTNKETPNSKLFENNFSMKGLNNDSVSPTDEDVSIKEDCINLQGAEYENRTRQSSTNCENSSGFKFVNVKNESSLNETQADDSQSETEASENCNTKTRQRDKYQLKCKICQKRYMKLGHLKNHLKAHTKADGFECTICSKKFRLLTVYEKHMRRFHNSDHETPSNIKDCGESDKEDNLKLRRLGDVDLKTEDSDTTQTKKLNKVGKRLSRAKKLSKENRATRSNGTPLLECSYCQQKFDFPSVLKRHVRSHTNERPYVCQICNKSFKQLGHLSQHSLTHTDYRSFQCATCGMKFESLDSLKIHSQSHRGDTVMYRPKEVYRLFECDNCKKVFTTKSVLERHIFTHTHERQFGCKVCGKRFKQAGHVKSHMLVHTGERKFECKVCSKKFSLSNSLKKHMYIHNGEKPYQCDVCGARFLEKRNLNGHLMTHTNERPFSCNICGKRYTLADTLRRHISAAHEDGRTYQCEICAKMFKQLAHLYVHKKVHTDERPYQCHLCEKNFKHKNVLKSHLAIHANLRPFECDVCKATFVRKTNLQTHIASAHMNERPYVCTICNKRFKQVSHLNGHVVVHSNSMPYQCDFCDRRCNRLDNLKKHMRLHTKTKE